MQPHHDRPLTTIVQTGRPHVEEQAVLALGLFFIAAHGRKPFPATRPGIRIGLRGAVAVLQRIEVPAQGVGFRGGMNRLAPPVGAPYRMPLKM